MSRPYRRDPVGSRCRILSVLALITILSSPTTTVKAQVTARGALQGTVFLHSGELEVSAVDLDAGGRAGWNVVIDRTYRSRTIGFSPMGSGWDSSIFRHLRPLPNGTVEYHDGDGEIWQFTQASGGGYTAPTGLFLRLARTDRGWNLIDQQWRITEFDEYERLRSESDEFYDPTKPGSGNKIYYLYDAEGRLARILDSLGRSTTVTYDDTTGLVREITDWRGRTVTYDHDASYNLTEVHLPAVANTNGVPRPTIRYGYYPGTTTYNDVLELGTNLISITDPREVATGGPARVKYIYGTTGNDRDKVLREEWGTGEFATFAYSPTGETTVTDVLGQQRKYTFVTPAGDRAHIGEVREISVPVWTGAPLGQLPATLTSGAPSVTTTDRVWTFAYANGVETSQKLADVRETISTWQPAIGAPGLILTSSTTTSLASTASSSLPLPPTAPITRVLTYQSGANGSTFLQSLAANGLTIEAPEPHRKATTTSSSNSNISATTEFDESGLFTKSALSGGTDAGSVGSKTSVEYFPASDSVLYRRAMPHIITAGDPTDPGALKTKIEYPSEMQVRTTDSRGVVTLEEFDAWNRPVHVSTTGPDLSAEETNTYDATGRPLTVVENKTNPSGAVESITTTYTYDTIGRRTSSTMDKVAVSGGAVTTTTQYDLPNRRTITTQPGGAVTTSELDTLGRVVRTLTNTGSLPGASPIERRFAYDIDDNRVYASDMFAARATAFDAHGRAVATKYLDGTITTTERDAWGRVTKTKDLDGTESVVSETSFDLTDAGRVKGVTTKVDTALTRRSDFAWDGDGRTTSSATNGRASKSTYDLAGRMKNYAAGAGNLATLTDIFETTEINVHSGVLPAMSTTVEKGAPPLTTTMDRGTSGAVTRQIVGTLEWTQTFDELGNVIAAAVPGRPPAKYDVDARGAVKTETLADGATKNFSYLPSGAQSNFSDPTNEPTSTQADLVGRPLKRTYADGTFEQVEWEGPRVKAVTDRQGRKRSFIYNGKEQLAEIRDGTGTTLDRLTYDSAGRLASWLNKDVEILWGDFDLDGNPKRTTQRRYKDGTGLSISSPPVVLDEYTQEHRWNGHGERTHWSMPAYAGLVLGVGWTKWVREQHDAMGNLIVLGKVDDPSATSAIAMMTAQFRNTGRPEARTIFAGVTATTPGAPIVRTYGYDPSMGLMNKMSVTAGGTVVAGTEVIYDGLQKSDARLLGVSGGQRFTKWRYDARSRLIVSVYGASDPNADPTVPVKGRAQEQLTPADFRYGQERVSQFDPTTLAALQEKKVDITRVDPPTMNISEKPGGGHKIDEVAKRPQVYPFGYSGAEVICDGRFTYTFDAKGHLLTATEKTLGSTKRRVVYVYSGPGRLVGRRAEYTTTGAPDPVGCAPATPPTSWMLEDRLQVLVADGLSADTTFVWDPITDRLITIAKAGATVSDPQGGLLKQIIHGGLGYDDPIETAVVDPLAPTSVNYLYPIYDEAGAGSLQAVLNKQGEIVARNLPLDPFGGDNVELVGSAIDRIAVTAEKDSTGTLIRVAVSIRTTDAISSSSVLDGVRLAAIDTSGSVIRLTTATPALAGANTVKWTLTAGDWTTLTTGAAALSIAATRNLRAAQWGANVPVLPAPEWATVTRPVFSSPDLPIEVRESLSSLSSFLAGVPTGGEATSTLYEVQELALVASGGNDSVFEDVLSARLHAHPFTEPLTQLDYVRSRWLSTANGSWLSPDPMGYRDSSNLYAFAGADPVNRRDPTGDISLRAALTDSEINAYEFETLELTDEEIRAIVGSQTALKFAGADDPEAAKHNLARAKFILLARMPLFKQYAKQLYELTRGLNPGHYAAETGWAIGSGQEPIICKPVDLRDKVIEFATYLAFIKGMNWVMGHVAEIRAQAVGDEGWEPVHRPLRDRMTPNEKGKLGERWSEQSAKAAGVPYSRHVDLLFTIRGKKVMINADLLIHENGGNHVYVESKFSPNAPYQPNQRVVIPELVKAGDQGLAAVVGPRSGGVLRTGRGIRVTFQGDVWNGEGGLHGH